MGAEVNGPFINPEMVTASATGRSLLDRFLSYQVQLRASNAMWMCFTAESDTYCSLELGDIFQMSIALPRPLYLAL